jgi:hypothetical protein
MVMTLGSVRAKCDGNCVWGSIENMWVEVDKYLSVLLEGYEGVPFVAPIFVWQDENGKPLMICVHHHFGLMWCF